jgi:hypothetical protein
MLKKLFFSLVLLAGVAQAERPKWSGVIAEGPNSKYRVARTHFDDVYLESDESGDNTTVYWVQVDCDNWRKRQIKLNEKLTARTWAGDWLSPGPGTVGDATLEYMCEDRKKRLAR